MVFAEMPGPPAGDGGDRLRELGERLERASDAAERMLSEAAQAVAGRAASAIKPPPAGWSAGGDDARRDSPRDEARRDSPRDEGRRDSPRHDAGGDATTGGEPGTESGEVELLLDVVHRLGELIPPELRRRLADAMRELLLAVRALIDWYLERLEQRHREPVEVQDIPIL